MRKRINRRVPHRIQFYEVGAIPILGVCGDVCFFCHHGYSVFWRLQFPRNGLLYRQSKPPFHLKCGGIFYQNFSFDFRLYVDTLDHTEVPVRPTYAPWMESTYTDSLGKYAGYRFCCCPIRTLVLIR